MSTSRPSSSISSTSSISSSSSAPVTSQHNKRRLANSSSSSLGPKKARRELETEQTLNLKDALEDESNASLSLSSNKKCTLCTSSKSLIKVEEGVHFRVNEAIDVELYLNSLLYGDDQRSVPKPILLCSRCILIVKKYTDQKSQIASLEAFRGLDDPIKLKKVKDIESMEKALKSKVSVRLKKLQDSDILKQQQQQQQQGTSFEDIKSENKRLSDELNKLQSELKNVSASLQDYKQRNLDLEFRYNKVNKKGAIRSNEKVVTTVARGTNTDSASNEGLDVETFQILLGERDKEMAMLDRALKSTIKVKDMAISAQNLMKYRNVLLEKKIVSLERAVKYSGDEKALLDSIDKITDTLDTLKTENDKKTETNMNLRSELSNIKEQMKVLQMNYTASQDLNKKLSLDMSGINENLEKKAKELDEASKKVESLTQELSCAKEEISTISSPPAPAVSTEELECLKEEISRRDNTIKAVKAKLSEKEDDLSSKAKRLIILKLEKSKCEKRIQEFEKIFDGVSEGSNKKEVLIKIKSQGELITKLKNDLLNANKEIESKEVDNAETLCLLNSEVRELKKDLESKNDKVNSLNSSLSALKASFEKCEHEKKDLKTTLATLRSLEKEFRTRVGAPSLNEVLATNSNNLFNLDNAKEYFGVGVEGLSENHLSKCLFLVNKLMQNFHATCGHLQGKVGTDNAELKVLYDQKFVKFSETLQLYHLGEDLIYCLYTEAFYAFFGSLPNGIFRRKLKSSDRLLKRLPNMAQAAEIVANTPILIDVLDSSNITSNTASNTTLPNHLIGRGLRVKTNLIATTANKMSTTNTITQSSYNSPPPLARSTITNEVPRPRMIVQQAPMLPSQPIVRADGQICYTTTANGHGAPLQPLDNISQMLSMPPNVNIAQ